MEQHQIGDPRAAVLLGLNFKCDICNFKSSSRKGIGVHMNRIHLNPPDSKVE